MARLIFGMNLSLDGYVDHDRFAPDPDLFAHWTAHVQGLTAGIHGRRIHQVMQSWDDDQPGWTAAERAFAQAWRRMPKWVASRTLSGVGPNATLVPVHIAAVARDLKARLPGEVAVSGTRLAASLGQEGLIDEYRLYYHPVVLGQGTPFFAGPRPPLRIVATDRIGGSVVRLTCVPA
jgi:riboflavin biosynthesis pyrimidine reductase